MYPTTESEEAFQMLSSLLRRNDKEGSRSLIRTCDLGAEATEDKGPRFLECPRSLLAKTAAVDTNAPAMSNQLKQIVVRRGVNDCFPLLESSLTPEKKNHCSDMTYVHSIKSRE